MGIYYERHLNEIKFLKISTKTDIIWENLWKNFFFYSLVELKKNGKKFDKILKFDVWEESSKERMKIRSLPFLIRDMLKPSKVFYLDIEKNLIKSAINVNTVKKKIVNGNVCFLPFKKDVFNLILDFSTTDHLDDYEFGITMEEINRILKKGGLYAIYHLNKEYFNIKKWNEIYSKKIPSYSRSFPEIKKFLEKNDFEILHTKFLFPFYLDTTLVTFQKIYLDPWIFTNLPNFLKASFLNSEKLNIFFFIIARKR